MEVNPDPDLNVSTIDLDSQSANGKGQEGGL
jgi:hypothetical protein